MFLRERETDALRLVVVVVPEFEEGWKQRLEMLWKSLVFSATAPFSVVVDFSKLNQLLEK